MEALADPIHIVLCGGFGVGKTMLFSRLSRFSAIPFNFEYCPTSGINEAIYQIPMINGVKLELHLYDLSARVLSMPDIPHTVVSILEKCDGALVVTDPLRMGCATWTDIAIDLLLRYGTRNICSYLLVNKMDVGQNDHVLTSRQLDAFVTGNEQLLQWFYTVSHPQLGDLDCSRGHYQRQKPIEDIIRKIVQIVLERRHERLVNLLRMPFALYFKEWKQHDLEDDISNLLSRHGNV